jgi:hypothetical protein
MPVKIFCSKARKSWLRFNPPAKIDAKSLWIIVRCADQWLFFPGIFLDPCPLRARLP